ncbi:hypothetical protein RHSIM_Rhsim03G0183800 [Rhododendron simsii]|uniref:Glycosyl transferase CAP10 domain-containing protein n=1 Tax=Rhododendron simsii TaxID=118357 RepID=A0A834H5E9_RHOSS|nr:hypothetical protein RHSIM_Rhsim03G0183800 [Rhododendron simsii]
MVPFATIELGTFVRLEERKTGRVQAIKLGRPVYAQAKDVSYFFFVDIWFCTFNRYKIYLEGFEWSVSEKYILACNSVTLLVKPHYYDFFTRGLMPMHHYWPIKDYDQCRSIKFAVEWGNNHEQEAQDIVKRASDFIQEDLKMDYVYDYMFHVFREYAKLLRYKPTIPKRAIEICSETLACPAVGLQNAFMMESMVKGPIDVSPCNMPPPYDPHAFRTLLRSKANSVSPVELWEQRYWENQAKYD